MPDWGRNISDLSPRATRQWWVREAGGVRSGFVLFLGKETDLAAWTMMTFILVKLVNL